MGEGTVWGEGTQVRRRVRGREGMGRGRGQPPCRRAAVARTFGRSAAPEVGRIAAHLLREVVHADVHARGHGGGSPTARLPARPSAREPRRAAPPPPPPQAETSKICRCFRPAPMETFIPRPPPRATRALRTPLPRRFHARRPASAPRERASDAPRSSRSCSARDPRRPRLASVRVRRVHFFELAVRSQKSRYDDASEPRRSRRRLRARWEGRRRTRGTHNRARARARGRPG